ncbi:MAG: hypothetical protein ACI36X_06185 [Bacteroidaceae bacterium]
MKKETYVCILALLAATACNRADRQAEPYLMRAEEALARGNYADAKRQIDTIRLCYPKAFAVRERGIGLMQRIELEEQRRSLAYLDSMEAVRVQECNELIPRFVLEKDTAYQEVGNYFYPTQTVEKNVGRTYLCAQVDERGRMRLTSVYCAARKLNHRSVRVVARDGSFAETPVSDDVYVSSDLGVWTEKVDYSVGADGDVAGFVALHADQPLTLELVGDRTYRIALTAADRKAIAEVYGLTGVLSALESIRKQQREARLKMEFVQRKMQERASK